MMNVLISLIVIIIEQCVCIPKRHIAHLKYISIFIRQSYLNKAGEKPATIVYGVGGRIKQAGDALPKTAWPCQPHPKVK